MKLRNIILAIAMTSFAHGALVADDFSLRNYSEKAILVLLFNNNVLVINKQVDKGKKLQKDIKIKDVTRLLIRDAADRKKKPCVISFTQGKTIHIDWNGTSATPKLGGLYLNNVGPGDIAASCPKS